MRAVVFFGGWLADFEDVGGLGCGFFSAEDDLAGDGVELGRFGGVGAGEGYGQATVAALTDGGDELDGAEEGDVELG